MSNSIKDIIKNPRLLFLTFGHRGWFNWMSDEQYIRIAYRARIGKKLDMNHPQTFNEKIQWLKLYCRKSEYTKMVDKQGAKEIVEEILGEEYIIPTLGVWDKSDDINFDQLPNQFVLKCTHDSGGLVICSDKNKLDILKAKRKLNSCLKHNFYWGQREWAYKDVKPRIIAEKYMVDESGTELKDYKFFCFNGEVKMFKIDFDRYIEHHANYYDRNCKLLPFGEASFPPLSDRKLTIPVNIKEMILIAEKLSQGIKFIRIDLYNINGKIYFGEYTFFPASGFGKWIPEEYDKVIGAWISLD